jgi:hypothetical protein
MEIYEGPATFMRELTTLIKMFIFMKMITKLP